LKIINIAFRFEFGLIDGAHSGRGYGHQFLHMIERNSCHLMVVDINGFQLDANAPYRTAFETIVQLVSELELYNEVHSRYLHLY
jgi:GTPase involved in cell partitioning and DNA repair